MRWTAHDTLTRLARLGAAAASSRATAEADREARDAEIERASLDDGLSVRQIAEATGLSPARVHDVVISRAAARQARQRAASGLDRPPPEMGATGL